MRRSVVATVLIVFTMAGVVFSGGLPRGFAQVVYPQGDEFNSSSFAAPFAGKCGQFATPASCPDPQGPTTWSLNTDSPGNLRIWSQVGSLIGTAAQASNNARNLFLQPVSAGADYTITTKLTFPANTTSPVGVGQTAGAIVYQGDDDFIFVGREVVSTTQSRIDFVQEAAGSTYTLSFVEQTPTLQPVYLRITKTGSVYQGFYSYDNVNFVQMTPTVVPTSTPTPTTTATGTTTATPGTPATVTPPTGYSASYGAPRVGLFSWGGTNSGAVPLAADFDWFRVGTNSLTPAPTATSTSTAGPTSTATAVATATNTSVPATSTSTPVPTPTPKPVSKPKAHFKYISLWYHVVRIGTFDHLEVQARNKSKHGIWVHVIFPSGRHFDYYENTNKRGHWTKQFSIPRNALSSYSSQAVITLQLWKGSSTAKNHLNFTVVR